ncbi:CubicO group peptidase (beta-lactamase class C family) [Mucilaginibacter sp. 3215]
MKLVKQGKLQLNNDLRRYLPDLPYNHINIYYLLPHTSGLEEYFAPPVRNILGVEPDNFAIEKAYVKANLKSNFTWS